MTYPGDPRQVRDLLVAEFDALRAAAGTARRSATVAYVEPIEPSSAPTVPVLANLPLITKGPFRGEREMSKNEFARWCGVAVGTVSDWIYTQRVQTMKRGTEKQSRVRIAHGERYRLRPPVVTRSRKAKGDRDAG
jgi:hypothetical protein